MSVATTRPNFFVLLELDPDAPWNPTEFEIRLKEKQNQWAREANSPKADVKNAANRNLRLSGEIQKVLREETSRREEAAQARSIVETSKAARRAELQFALELYQSGTSVTREEFKRLATMFVDIVSEDDLKARLGLPIVETAEQAAGHPPEGLDPSTARRIRDNLKFLGEASLYSLLSKESTNSSAPPLGPESPSADLLAAARQFYGCVNLSIDTGPENTARKRLAGDAMDVFGDEVKRRRYDTSLRREPLERLLEEVERLCQVAGRITPERAALFLRKARAATVPIAAAVEALNQLIIAKKWPQLLLSDSAAAVERLHSCANCHRLNEPADKYCRWCGDVLWLDCPNCGTKDIDANVLRCGVCKFPLTRRRWVSWTLDEAERLIRAADWSGAAEQLHEVRTEWAPRSPDDLVQRMVELEEKLKPWRERLEAEREKKRQREEEERKAAEKRREEERAKLEAFVEKIEPLLNTRQLYTAQRLLTTATLPKAEHADYKAKGDAYRAKVREGIAKAEHLAAQAHEAHTRGDDEAAANHCYEAIAVADDCADARALLAKLPVEGPKNLQIEAIGYREVRLTWDPPSSSHVDGYTIRRTTNSAPVKHDEGVLVEMPPRHKTSSADIHAEQGVPVYYAVFSRTGNRYSRPAVSATLLAAPVVDLAATITPLEVHLHWQPPSVHMRAVRVRRAEGRLPKSIEDGHEVLGATRTDIIDRVVQSGIRYGYAVFAEYAGISGRPVWSNAATIFVTPQTPPSPITDLHVTRRDHVASYAIAELTCTPSRIGESFYVQYIGTEPPRLGSVARWNKLTEKRVRLPAEAAPQWHSWLGPGSCWYTAIVRLDDMGYVGASVPFNCVNEVDDLRPDGVVNDVVRVRWNWPRQCTRVELASSQLDWPMGTQGVRRDVVTRPAGAGDDSEGAYDLQVTAAKEVFVTATAYARWREHEIGSSGQRLRIAIGQRPQLICKVEKRAFSRVAPRSLTLEMRGSTIAPALVIVCQHGRRPHTLEDGEVLYKNDSMQWPTRRISLDLKGAAADPGTFIGIFLTGRGEADAVEVVTPWLQLT